MEEAEILSQIGTLKSELDEVRVLLSELKPTAEAIRKTQVAMVAVSEDTNKNVHEAKHGSIATQRNMSGFTDLTAQQYNHLNAVISEFRIIVAELKVERKYTEEKLDELELYTGEIRAIVSTQLFKEIVEENKAGKQFRTRAQNVWYLFLALGAIAAIVTGVIAAVKNLGGLLSKQL